MDASSLKEPLSSTTGCQYHRHSRLCSAVVRSHVSSGWKRLWQHSSGGQNWAGFDLIGSNGTVGLYSAATTFAQLLGASGYSQSESSLQPGLPTTTFRTGANAGNVAGVTATFTSIPANAPMATMEMVAWDNSSGLYPTWTQASVAWGAGLIAGGKSGLWNQDMAPPDQPAANLINSQDPSQHVVSFNLYFIPEPSSCLLGALAAGLLLLRTRFRKTI